MGSAGRDIAVTAMMSSLWIIGSAPSYVAGGGLGGVLSAAFYLVSGNMVLYLVAKLTTIRILPLASAASVGILFIIIPPAAGYGVFLLLSNIALGSIYTVAKNLEGYRRMLLISIVAGGVSGAIVTSQFALLRGSIFLVIAGVVYGVVIAPIGFTIGYLVYTRLRNIGVIR